jgi:hypothetical protein
MTNSNLLLMTVWLSATQMLSGRGRSTISASPVWSRWASDGWYVVEDELLSASCTACKQNNLSLSTTNLHWCPPQVSTEGYNHIKHIKLSIIIVLLVSAMYQMTLTLENFNESISPPSLWTPGYFCRRKKGVTDSTWKMHVRMFKQHCTEH